jgi:hypothetical protein
MRRWFEILIVFGAGPILAGLRPAWTPTTEDRLVVAVWLLALLVWCWLITVGGVHVWATRTGRRRWRHLSGTLLPAGVRRRVEALALAGMLVAPMAACADRGEDASGAPILVLEATIPLVTSTTTSPVDGSTPPTTAAPTTAPPTTAPPTTAPPTTAPPTSAAPTTAALAGAPTGAPRATSPAGAGSPGAAPSTVLAPPGPVEVADQPDPTPDPLFPAAAQPGTRIVVRGDHLWAIAASHLSATLGRVGTDAEVDHYWRALIEENRSTLRSGDPDMIHPGEVLRLPPVPS